MIERVYPDGIFSEEYTEIIAQKAFLAPTMGVHFHLFGNKPASGWAFYRMPGAVLACRGRSGSLCGSPDDPEELASFLHFLQLERITTDASLPGWPVHNTLYSFYTEHPLPMGAPPAGLTLDTAPRVRPLADYLFADAEEAVRDNFYADTCTKLAHNLARLWTLRRGDALVSMVVAAAIWQGDAYMACGETVEALRGQGFGGWLIATAANSLLVENPRVSLLCEEKRCHFYRKLGFALDACLYQYGLPEL